jgi:small multidrug resistance family-3 protein
MASWGWFLCAAACEIGGCYTFWLWLRLDKSALWLIPGAIGLMLFAFILTRVETEYAGRAYAAYGGIYIVSSLVWLSTIEGTRPYITDIVGAILCLTGAAVILYGGRI